MPESELVLTPMFWDCNCKDDYIKHQSQIWCGECNAHRDEEPESRLREVIRMITDDCGVEIHAMISR